MSFEHPLKLEAYYLKNEKCDKLKEYIKSETKNRFTFQGDLTPHGYYDVRISYNPEKRISLSTMKKHYQNLLDIIIGSKKEF